MTVWELEYKKKAWNVLEYQTINCVGMPGIQVNSFNMFGRPDISAITGIFFPRACFQKIIFLTFSKNRWHWCTCKMARKLYYIIFMCVRCRQNSDVRVKLFPSPQAAITLLGGAAENATIGDPVTLPFRCSAPTTELGSVVAFYSAAPSQVRNCRL